MSPFFTQLWAEEIARHLGVSVNDPLTDEQRAEVARIIFAPEVTGAFLERTRVEVPRRTRMRRR